MTLKEIFQTIHSIILVCFVLFCFIINYRALFLDRNFWWCPNIKWIKGELLWPEKSGSWVPSAWVPHACSHSSRKSLPLVGGSHVENHLSSLNPSYYRLGSQDPDIMSFLKSHALLGTYLGPRVWFPDSYKRARILWWFFLVHESSVMAYLH